jgi:phage-related holin
MLSNITLYMQQVFNHPFLKAFISFIFVSLEYTIGWFDLVIRALLILLILDFVMWFSIAFRDHKISRKKLMSWLYKMMVYFGGVAMSHWTDIIIFHQSVEFWFQNFIIVYLGVNESISIIKHMADLGVKVPMKLITRLESYRDTLDIK